MTRRRFPAWLTRPAIYAAAPAFVLALGLLGRSAVWSQIGPYPGDTNPPPLPPPVPVVPGLAPGSGSLLICGGGKMPDEVKGRFLDLAGGANARIVVIPSAHAAADAPNAEAIYLDPWKALGAGRVSMLHTRSRDRVADPEFLRPLLDATGVWIGGGKQSALADLYGGTEVENQLRALVARGGVVGGSSAGAAIMTRVMIQGGRTEATEGRGFDLLSDAVVDQHFLKRKRLNRLLGLLTKHPDLLGFGIDEGTALLVRGNRLAVLGDSYVVACLPCPSGQPPRVEFLRSGDQADLASLRGPSPRIAGSLDVDTTLSSEH